MRHYKYAVVIIGLIISFQIIAYAHVDPIGLTSSQLKKAVAKDKELSSSLQKGTTSDYEFWEKYSENLHAEILVWLSNDKVVKAQWTYGGDSVNTIPSAENEFYGFKKQYMKKYGKPILNEMASNGYVSGWDHKGIRTTLSLELPTTKYGLPILVVTKVIKNK